MYFNIFVNDFLYDDNDKNKILLSLLHIHKNKTL